MSNSAYFFDIDSLVRVENKAWIVDKKNPTKPILKISKSDLHLIESGIFKKQGHKIEFNGKVFWLPTELYNKIKIKAKVFKTHPGNLAISLQEFYNKPVVDELYYTFNLDTILNLKNTQPDIYIICSKQTKKNYESIVNHLKAKLEENGLSVKNFYFITDSFYNIDSDEIRFKKIRLLLQHSIGFQTEQFKFSDKEITQYSKVYLYDNQIDTLHLAEEINPLLNLIYQNTRGAIKDLIKENIKELEPSITINKVNENQFNRLETTKVILELSKFIKTFESFKFAENLKYKF